MTNIEVWMLDMYYLLWANLTSVVNTVDIFYTSRRERKKLQFRLIVNYPRE